MTKRSHSSMYQAWIFGTASGVRPALVDTDLHVHSASAQGKVSGGRGRGGSYFVH